MNLKNNFSKSFLLSSFICLSMLLTPQFSNAKTEQPKLDNTQTTETVEIEEITAPAVEIQEITTPLVNKTAVTFLGPDTIANVAEMVSPAVVNIDVENVREYKSIMPDFPFGEGLFKQFFSFSTPNGQFQQQPQFKNKTFKKKSLGNGSGVIISEDGYILTNNHVVRNAENIKITLNNGNKYDAKVVGVDGFSDIAVLKVEATGLTAAKLGQSNNLRPGEWVVAIGNSLGYDHTVTVGIISALARHIDNANVEFIQTDAAINPGNSGGPLVNLNGEVVGINTAIAGIGTSIGFSIPIDTARQVSETLISKGYVERPWLGIAMGMINENIRKSLGLDENTNGVVVVQVKAESPASIAGLRPGDIIQRVDGEKVSEPDRVQNIIRDKKVDDELNLQIIRDRQLIAIPLKIGQWPGSLPAEELEEQGES